MLAIVACLFCSLGDLDNVLGFQSSLKVIYKYILQLFLPTPSGIVIYGNSSRLSNAIMKYNTFTHLTNGLMQN